MPIDLETRVAQLEEEVRRLTTLLQSLNIERVNGDLSITLQGVQAVHALSVNLNEVSGDVSVSNAGGTIATLNIDASDVCGDLSVSAHSGHLNIETGDVSGNLDISSHGGPIQVQVDNVNGEIYGDAAVA